MDWRSAALCAVLTVEIMQPGYGIGKFLLSILYPYLSAFDQNMVGYMFMLAGELAALLLTRFCYVMVQTPKVGENNRGKSEKCVGNMYEYREMAAGVPCFPVFLKGMGQQIS